MQHSFNPDSRSEAAEFATGPSGEMLLFDAALSGNDLKDGVLVFHLVPGQYGVRAWCLQSMRLTLVIRAVARIGAL
jgi:hypothetical protein